MLPAINVNGLRVERGGRTVLDGLNFTMALGLLVSAFARSEFQAVQFLPAFVLPQLRLCGLIAPREQMAGALETASGALPMTYAVDAMTELTVGTDLLVVALATAAALALGAATLRRRSA
jgi:ABC-2 type transport system permease protein